MLELIMPVMRVFGYLGWYLHEFTLYFLGSLMRVVLAFVRALLVTALTIIVIFGTLHYLPETHDIMVATAEDATEMMIENGRILFAENREAMTTLRFFELNGGSLIVLTAFISGVLSFLISRMGWRRYY